MVRFCMMLMSVGLVVAIGCERKLGDMTTGKVTSGDVRRDTGQAVETTAVFSEQSKEQFQTKLDARLKESEAEMAKLREKGRDLKDEAKVQWDKTMADLEIKRDAARAKLTEVSKSSGEAWKDVRQGAQSAWAELDKAFRDASSKF